MTDSFDITKNVEETFDVIIKGYNVSSSPISLISDTIEFSLLKEADFAIYPNSENITSPSTPKIHITALNTFTASAPTLVTTGSAGYDAYTSKIYTSSISGRVGGVAGQVSGTTVAVGREPNLGDFITVWFEFPTVNIAKSTTLVSAIFSFVPAESPDDDPWFRIQIVGDASLQPTDFPTSEDDLLRRTGTGFIYYFGLSTWTAGCRIEFNMKELLQGIVNAAGWDSGHTLGVMIINDSNGRKSRWIYGGTAQTDPAKQPRLIITI
jgi:hypothetical protein